MQELNFEAFYLAELKNITRHGSEIKASCPFTHLHKNEDRNPSFTVNVSKGTYLCNTCKSRGNVHTLLMHLYAMSSEEAWFTLGDNLNIPRPDYEKQSRPPIDAGLVRFYQDKLRQETGRLRLILTQERGLTDETIEMAQLGWDDERITIPIYNEYNDLVNFRRYAWDAPDPAHKFYNYRDEFGNLYGEMQLYGIDNLLNPEVKELVYCEGELDKILLEQYGFKAITPTSGTGAFRPEWVKLFKGKTVYVVQDNDEAGTNGAKSIADTLYRVADVRILQWPDDFAKKGDPTDWFVAEKRTVEDFQKLLDAAPSYSDKTTVQKETTIKELHLAQAANYEYMNARQRIQIMVSGKDTAPYVAPKKVKIVCTPSGKFCEGCEVAFSGGEHEIEFDASRQSTINLIQCTKGQQEQAIKEEAGIIPKCTKCKFEIVEYMNIEEIRAIPQADNDYSGVRDQEYVVRKCFYIGRDLKTNQRYTMEGYSHAEPKTQYVTHIFDKAKPEQDRVDSFKMTPEIFESLKMFQPTDEQSIAEKFNEIHQDFERNVTYVWERRDLGIAVDLVYHTALSFYFQEQFVKKGWAELLIIGDSGQAKSTLVERMMKHYKLGEFYSGESSKRTGLVYSFQQTQKRWFLTWGAWPLNDGGLIVLDEFSGIPEDELANMSDVRSSGVARATGVITAETNARTRAIFLSNPRNGRQLNTETHGVQAVLKLFGKAEDVRRLDLVVGVASGDIDVSLINRALEDFPTVAHKYTSDLSRYRVLWAWSRKPNQIKFSKDAITHILKSASMMGRKYSSRIPIVESADQRLKIARMSISCAACMFSTDDGTNLIVGKEHVKFVVEFMQKVYDNKNLDYNGYSGIINSANDDSEDRIKDLRRKFSLLPVMDVNELADILYSISYFRRNDLQDATGFTSDDTVRVMAFLSINKIIENSMSGYRKLPAGIKLLSSILTDPILQEEIDKNRKEAYRSSEF
jgi:5S rRNA maturation endonuclease (ribonuclease M5)